jgi:DNA-binding Lrp family transcriptional regulator
MDPVLQILEENAHTPRASIAEQLKMTEAQVESRIAQLESDRIILAYKAIVDDDKADSTLVKAVIEVKLTPERGGGFNRIADRIARHSEVKDCFLMSGGYDLLVLVEGRSLREVAAFVSEKLATIDEVQGTATHFLLKTYKQQGVLMGQEPEDGQRLAVAP